MNITYLCYLADPRGSRWIALYLENWRTKKAKASNCVRGYLGVFLCLRTMSASRDANHKTLGDRPNTHEASPRQALTPRR
jgi:hypothetical protein